MTKQSKELPATHQRALLSYHLQGTFGKSSLPRQKRVDVINDLISLGFLVEGRTSINVTVLGKMMLDEIHHRTLSNV